MNDQPITGPAEASAPPIGSTAPAGGTRDGSGAADHDQPYAGYRAYQFTTQQRLRLLVLRGEVLDSRMGQGRHGDDLHAA